MYNGRQKKTRFDMFSVTVAQKTQKWFLIILPQKNTSCNKYKKI